MLLFLSLIETSEDEKFFEILCKTYQEDMYKSAFSVVHNQHDAEDAVQNAFVAIMDKGSVIRGLEPRNQRAYLCRSAYNCAINIYNKHKKESQIIISTGQDLSAINKNPDIYGEFCSNDNVEKIRNCILRLPETYRDVVYLHCINGLNECQISAVLGIKNATVRQKLRRGRKILIKNISGLEANN